jgi:hypothetical protein
LAVSHHLLANLGDRPAGRGGEVLRFALVAAGQAGKIVAPKCDAGALPTKS